MNTGKGRTFVLAVSLLSTAGLLTGGLWALAAPESFAQFAYFPPPEHFEHDLGAFQIGAAVTLLLALVWSDALATALAGFEWRFEWPVHHPLDLGPSRGAQIGPKAGQAEPARSADQPMCPRPRSRG